MPHPRPTTRVPTAPSQLATPSHLPLLRHISIRQLLPAQLAVVHAFRHAQIEVEREQVEREPKGDGPFKNG